MSENLSFLQAIYIHQDLIEESLLIFKCHTPKGDLKKDENYSINREIRNELVGHPIRKEKVGGQLKLLSSTIFHYRFSENTNISYVRYHIESGYKGQKIFHTKKDILKRHEIFLITYLDVILKNAFKILHQFRKKIIELENAQEKAPFDNFVGFIFDSFEKVSEQNYLYDKKNLSTIYQRRAEHPRYENLINLFHLEVNIHLKETKREINRILEDSEETDCYNSITDYDYIYELSKLISKRSLDDFEFYSELLIHKCKTNNIALVEIENMKNNFYNDLEYYCSYYFLYKILSKK